MNLQQLPEFVKDRLMQGESVTSRKKWYDPEKSKYTDEEEATLKVSEWRLRFNGKLLKEFLGQVWMKMAKTAEGSSSTQVHPGAEQTKGKGVEILILTFFNAPLKIAPPEPGGSS